MTTTTTTRPTTTTTTTTTNTVAPLATESTIRATILEGVDCTPEPGRKLEIDRWKYSVRLQDGTEHYGTLGGDVFEIQVKPQVRKSDGAEIDSAPIVVRVSIRSLKVTWRKSELDDNGDDVAPWVRVSVTAVARSHKHQPEMVIGAWMRAG